MVGCSHERYRSWYCHWIGEFRIVALGPPRGSDHCGASSWLADRFSGEQTGHREDPDRVLSGRGIVPGDDHFEALVDETLADVAYRW